jgi:hypothetical protein
MKRILAFSTIASLALWGCFDDSSSAEDELSSSSVQETLSSESSQGAPHEDFSADSPAEPPELSAGSETLSSAAAASSAATGALSSAEATSSGDQGYPLSATSSETLDVPKSGFIRGKCMNNSLAKAASSGESTASEKLPDAVLGYAGGEPFIEIHNVSDYCDLEAEISQKVKKDTLFVAYYDIGMASKCICTFDSHRFFIDRENASVQFFSFKDVVYKVVDLMID